MNFTATKRISCFRCIITLLFKITVGFQLEILCLSLAGIIAYLFSILLGLTQISNQLIFFWLLTGTGLAVFAWSKFRYLLYDHDLIKQTSVANELAFVVSSIFSTVVAFKISLSHTFLNSGDYSSFVRLTTQFTQFRGPWNIGAFIFEYTSPDRIQLHRNAGPFYPQATHFIVAMVDQTLNLNNLPGTTQLVTVLLCFTVLPLLLVLLGQSVRLRSNISDLISLSFIFAILLPFNLNRGQIPADIGVTLMTFVLVFSMSLTSIRNRNISILFGCLLLAFVHPSALASLCLLYAMTLDRKFRFSIFSKLISVAPKINPRLTGIITVLVFALGGGIVALYVQVAPLIELWSSFHINPEFDPSLGLNLIWSVLRFVLQNFLLFGHLSAINIVSVLLVSFYVAIFRTKLRGRIRIPELVLVVIVLSSSLGGATGFLGLAKLPSIFWYSDPMRVVHIWTIFVFYRICKGTKSRNHSSVLSTSLLLCSCAAYTFNLFAISI